MSIKLGNKIPPNIAELLNLENLDRAGSVIFMITTDPQNYPHIALLSPFQVIIDEANTLYFSVYRKSSTHDYLVKNRKFSIVLQDIPSLLYLKCEIIPTPSDPAEQDIVHHFFRAKPIEILRDVSEKAPLTSEMLFETNQIAADYVQEFLELSKFINKVRNQK